VPAKGTSTEVLSVLVWAARGNWRPALNSGFHEDNGRYAMTDKRECQKGVSSRLMKQWRWSHGQGRCDRGEYIGIYISSQNQAR